MGLDFALPPLVSELEEALLRFAAEVLRPGARGAERAGAWPAQVVRTLDDFAVNRLDVPAAWGGEEAGLLAKVVALEALASGDAGGLPGYDVGPSLAAMLACPDAESVTEIAEACLAHEAASHLALRASTAESGRMLRLDWAAGSVPSGWLWTVAGDTLVLDDMGEARVDDAPAAAFDASSGVRLAHFEALPTGRWTLEPADALALRGRARLWPAAVSVGVARASLDYAVAYARERVVAGRPVAHHQGNAFAIAEAAARLDGSRLAVRAAASRFDAGHPDAGAWATLAYLEATEAAPALCDLGLQLLGGHGYLEDHPVEKWFRESRMLSLLWGGRRVALSDAPALCAVPDALMEG